MLFYILQFCIIFLKTIFAYIPGGGGGGGVGLKMLEMLRWGMVTKIKNKKIRNHRSRHIFTLFAILGQ